MLTLGRKEKGLMIFFMPWFPWKRKKGVMGEIPYRLEFFLGGGKKRGTWAKMCSIECGWEEGGGKKGQKWSPPT